MVEHDHKHEAAPGAARRKEERLRGLDSAGVVAKAKAAKEIESTYRVYVQEWLTYSRHATEEEARQRIAEKHEGRLRPEDIRTVPDHGAYLVQLRRWNVAGEWKTWKLATDHLARLIADSGHTEDSAKVVGRNSRTEHLMRQYGDLKLPKPKDST